MKKITLLIFAITYSISSFSQQQIALHSAVSITLPTGAKKITKDLALAHVRKLYSDTMAQNSITTPERSENKKYFYTVHNILIQLNGIDTTYDFEKNRLIKLKNGLDGMAKGGGLHTSTIIKGNQNAAVVTKDKIGSTYVISFFCINDANTRILAGTVKYNKEDEAEATSIVNNLLASIKFKD